MYMAYRAWIWTEDDSPLYKYAGFLPLRVVTQTKTVDFRDNSVWKCHLNCSSYSSMGMRGNACYCLYAGYETVSPSTTENRCRGNFDELCGNVDGMSVYKLENIRFTQQRSGKCAYVVRNDANLTTYSSSYGDCDRKTRRYACYVDDLGHDECDGSGCVSLRFRPKKTWYGASTDCDLVKLTTPVQNNLRGIMQSNKKYWIGLYKPVHRKWLHGQWGLIYDGYMYFPDTDPDTMCLTIYRLNNGSTRLYWIACDLDQRWICENVTESITSTKMPPTPSSSHPSSASTLSEDVSTVPGNHSSNRSSPAGTSDAKKTPYNPQTDAGGFIGLGVGSVVLVVLAVLIVVFLLRRQKKLCFETKGGNQPIHVTSAAESSYCSLAFHTQTEDGTYSVITHPDTTDGATAIVQPNTHSDNTYINTPQINDEAEIQEA